METPKNKNEEFQLRMPIYQARGSFLESPEN